MTPAKFHSSEDVRDSIESLHLVHGGNRRFIYWILLLVTTAAVVCLPLIKVDISVGAPGQVRPAIERLAVYPAIAGKIKELFVSDNRSVRRGDVLLVMDSSALDARLEQNQSQQLENNRAWADLDVLLSASALSFAPAAASSGDQFANLSTIEFTLELPKKLSTAPYVRQHALLLSDIQRLLLQRGKALHDRSRNQTLYEKELISELDFDQQRFAVETVERELELTIQQTLSRWQSEKLERELKKVDLESEAKQLQQQKDFYTLRAPIDGTAIGFNGLQPGLYCPADQRIGEISPDGGLQADVYIGMRDIGFVRQGQTANVQVDAFPYTEWGMIKGRVRQISQDFVQLGQQVAFKAVIDLDRTQLKSASGVVVDLRRGMTINARFLLKKRTLYNLLYSKLSESLDPQAKPTSD